MLLVLLCAAPASAKALCVNASTGSDATSYASNNGTTTCWATIGRAAWGSTNRAAPNTSEAAQAGDTVTIAAGAYTTTGVGNRYTPAFNPANSGTSGNPITFVASSGVTISYTSGTGPVIGSYQRDYITWRGFNLDEATTPAASDTGLVVVWEATGCVIEYNTLDGNGDPSFGTGELHNAVRVNAGGSTTVRHNVMHDVRGTSAGANASCVLLDQSAGGTVENNTCYDSDGGIFIKRNYNAEGAWTFRKNYIHDTAYGIRADQLTDTTPQYETLIYQNLLVNVTNGAFQSNHYETYETYDLTIVNNTVVTCGVGFDGAELTASASHRFYNNIVTGCPLGFRTTQYDTDWASGVFDAQHNSYYTVTNAMTYRYELSGQTTINWATWVALPQDATSPASLTASDPLFANSAGNDYRLCTGSGTPHASCSGASPAIALGVDILDLDGDSSTLDNIPAGAYVTGDETIGVGGAGSSGTIRLRIVGAAMPWILLASVVPLWQTIRRRRTQ